MSIKINYAMIYTEQIRDLILDKLTILFNKAILDAPVRLLLRVPDMFDMKRTQRYREIFEEVSVSRFTIENPTFWNMRNIHNMQDYCLSMDVGTNDMNLFIEQSTLVYDMPKEISGDIIVADEYEYESLTTQYISIIELLNENGYDIQTKEDFHAWDMSCCHFNNDIKKILYFTLEEILKKIKDSGRYISAIETHILISALLSEIMDEFENVKFVNLGLKRAKIDPVLVEHMYSLI